MRDERLTVVMTGATGFVGTALRRGLLPHFRLVGLTRSAADIGQIMGEKGNGDETVWRSCDLFSLLELEKTMQGADYAIYLASARLPSSRLVQGTFEDIDLIMADNFARAAQFCGVKHILYLGRLIPTEENLAGHRAGRVEIEQALGSGITPLTTLRAGLIVGPGGSSVRIMINLVRRLPVMILPEWTMTQTQPIAIDDVVRAVRICLGDPQYFGGRFDIGGPDVMTFREMQERTAGALGKKRVTVAVPHSAPGLSKMWVALLGGASRYLVGPLVDSLRHPLVAKASPLQATLVAGAKSFDVALRESFDKQGRALPDPREPIRAIDDRAIRRAQRVRSVQRLPLPEGWTARQVTAEYYRWLPGAVRPFLRCDIEPWVSVRVCLGFTRWRLIEFTCAPHRSSEERQLLYITGGALARTKNNAKGRIEFREILDRRCMLAAIHDYTPTLPWGIYRYTQALFHLVVMRRFGNHLARIKAIGMPPEAIKDLALWILLADGERVRSASDRPGQPSESAAPFSLESLPRGEAPVDPRASGPAAGLAVRRGSESSSASTRN